jgi:signal transduction histidine kinase
MFVALGLFIIAGGYVVARGLSKELEVARLQSDFVAAVSHEFRTPVAAVKQLTEVLDDGRVTDEPRRARYYKLLRREGDRLQRLVEGLLDFGKMESHATEYRFEELDAGDVVRGITDEFAEGDGAPSRLSVAVESDLAIRGDREAIGRALRNLIDNALKYSPSDSPITVEAAPSDGRVIIRVRDWGPGIAPAEHRRIFSKFVRGESAKATGAKGTGIGLAMVAHIMRAHRGEVRVESLPGEGATFSLVLPTGRSL